MHTNRFFCNTFPGIPLHYLQGNLCFADSAAESRVVTIRRLYTCNAYIRVPHCENIVQYASVSVASIWRLSRLPQTQNIRQKRKTKVLSFPVWRHYETAKIVTVFFQHICLRVYRIKTYSLKLVTVFAER